MYASCEVPALCLALCAKGETFHWTLVWKSNTCHCTLVSSPGIFLDLSRRSFFSIACCTLHLRVATCWSCQQRCGPLNQYTSRNWEFVAAWRNHFMSCRQGHNQHPGWLCQPVCLHCSFCYCQEDEVAMFRYHWIVMLHCLGTIALFLVLILIALH